MINIGNKIFPLFAPKVRAEPIIPISEIERPPKSILIRSHGINFRLMFNRTINNGKEITQIAKSNNLLKKKFYI